MNVLVTGATDGLGRALADRLADHGHDLLLHGRRPDALGEAADDLEKRTGRRPRAFLADFSELAQVRALAAEVGEVDVLVNNAGIGSGAPDLTTRQTSADGYELRFAVNHLAAALLALELRDRVRRIVQVASLGQAPVDYDDVMLERSYDGGRAYAQSNLAMITFGGRLAQRADATVNSLHPGTYMPTKIVMQTVGSSIDTLETGVAATARLVEDPALATTTGAFFDRQQRADPMTQPDPERLWRLTLDLVGVPG